MDRPTPTGPPAPDLRIVESRIYRGGNIWSYHPAVHLVVDLVGGPELQVVHPPASRRVDDLLPPGRVVTVRQGDGQHDRDGAAHVLPRPPQPGERPPVHEGHLAPRHPQRRRTELADGGSDRRRDSPRVGVAGEEVVQRVRV